LGLPAWNFDFADYKALYTLDILALVQWISAFHPGGNGMKEGINTERKGSVLHMQRTS
jgi:hypothetical protein